MLSCLYCCFDWQEAHISGVALVTACAQENAERYCQGLRNNGLTATMEPDGGPAGGSPGQ